MDREQIVSQLPKLMQRILERAEDTRFTLTLPSIQGEHVYATDGRIMARLSVGDLGDDVRRAIDQQKDKPPKMSPMADWDGQCYSEEPIALDRLDLPDLTPQKCTRCDGDGHRDRECGECGSPYEWECPDCDGVGEIRRESVPIEVAPGIHLNNYLTAVLSEAGALLFASKLGGYAKPVRFTCPDGIEGLVMQMRVDAVEAAK